MTEFGPLDDAAVTGPMTRGAAHGRGVTDAELRGRLWRPVHRGVTVWHGHAAEDPRMRVAAAGLVLPSDGALTGWAAGYHLGAPWLDGIDPRATPDDPRRLLALPVAVPYARVMRRPGITTIRAPLLDGDVVAHNGVVVTSPCRTAFELLRQRDPMEALVGIDALLHFDVVTAGAVRNDLERRRGWRGVAQARQVLGLADGRVKSPMESRLRHIWVGIAGLPRPEVNTSLWDKRTGSFAGEPDLFDHEAGLVGEQDGAVHRDPQRHRADNIREQRLEHLNLTVVRFDGYQTLFQTAFVAEEVQRRRESALRRRRSLDRWVLHPRDADPMQALIAEAEARADQTVRL